MTIRAWVQVISYAGRFPAVIDDALRAAQVVVREGSQLRLVPIPQLVALKLYAGGYKSKSDIIELLAHNPDVDRADVRAVTDVPQSGNTPVPPPARNPCRNSLWATPADC